MSRASFLSRALAPPPSNRWSRASDRRRQGEEESKQDQKGLVALTVWRPWSWMISDCGKNIENRSWPPPAWVVGRYVAIHAGKHFDYEARLWAREKLGLIVPCSPQIPEGIVAIARLAGSTRKSDDVWFAGPEIDGTPNYGWLLEDIVRIDPPVVCKGAQGLWPVPEDLLATLRERWSEGRRRTACL